MADVDITSLSVEISAESHGAELNIDKLATAISNLRTKGNVTKVVNSLDRLSASIYTAERQRSQLQSQVFLLLATLLRLRMRFPTSKKAILYTSPSLAFIPLFLSQNIITNRN